MQRIIKISLVFFLNSCYTELFSQTLPLSTISNLTAILSESSGITKIGTNRLYTHNDSGGADEIYELDTLGNLIRIIEINSANNSDWEDITQDDLHNIYIGDFGNNNNDRTNLRVYKIPSPSSFTGNSTTAELIEFNYPDQTLFPPAPSKRNYDAEGFVWYNDSLFIFSKNRTAPFNGYCKIYKIPATPGTHTATICDSIFLCGVAQTECWVTSAALSADKTQLALLNHNKIWLFSCFNDSRFFTGSMATIILNSYTQKEGITFKNNQQVYITDEFNTLDNSGGYLYEADLKDYLEMPFVQINPDSIICDNCSLSVDSFSGAISWSNGLFGPSITPTYTGWYSATATSLNQCTMRDSVYVSYLQGTNENGKSSTSLNITLADSRGITGTFFNAYYTRCTLYVTNLSGKLITSISLPAYQKNTDFTIPLNISSGMYLLHTQTTNENKTYKVIIAD